MALKPGTDLGRITLTHLVDGQIGRDHHGLARQQPVIDEGVQSRGDKLTGQFRTQIVNDQQIALV